MAKKRMAADERREQILQTAARLFADEGFNSTTTRRLAEAAGINEATIYKHFATKEDLFDAVIEHAIYSIKDLQPPAELLNLPSMTDSQLRKFIIEAIERVLERGAADTTVLRLMLYSILQNHRSGEQMLKRFAMPFISHLADSIRLRQANGLARADLDPFSCALTVISMAAWFNIVSNVFKPKLLEKIDRRRHVEHIADIFLNGISAIPNGEPV